ncbi:MAG: hypothetical protein E5X23_08450 [Mesorhizobium sp.]|uniref:pPIWI-associating nuclease domain-containing protein n=3 Tax=Mesorhizobium TaxID=68287 RepID=UPI000FCC42AA|nr:MULTISPECIES: hypothetical protein [unclassified Mesorhizobium]MCT2581127.1 hypothetical protein [Mesorhizobium sp. P13.3]MDF3170113.1 hypothetical protein [Mesorhizobium sp. P16.1]MDF3187039.1 hypothetical protein [Mesorhizobium sp. ICCV3110.1]RUV56571.1 hypothetical protein EOA64_28230 [Mesorhizobium sp. M1A.F.Ca.IN.022.02.1.1]RWG23637.1 MAG: hypothetical protein EOQ53_03440 [Mesorhizobium sp.]
MTTPELPAHLGYKAPSWETLWAAARTLQSKRPNDEFMAKVLEGAFDVGCGKNPIRGNLCAAALRELVSHILHAMAPDEKVLKCVWYSKQPDTNGPTRRQRATFIMQGGLSVEFVTNKLHLDHDETCKPLIDAMNALSKSTHVREETILDDDEKIRELMDDTLGGVLALFDAAAHCQNEVYRQLEREIDDAVFDKFLSETIQELDELSTHTTFEGHESDEVRVVYVDEEVVKFAVSGLVYVELQYGSNSDLRKGEGAVMGDYYPYTATLCSKASNPEEVIGDSVDVKVDNSSFYDNGEDDYDESEPSEVPEGSPL